MLMSFLKRHAARQSEVHLYGYTVADAPCAQVVYVADSLVLLNDFEYALFGLSRQTLLKQFASRLPDNLDGSQCNENAHYDGRYGIEHSPLAAQDYSTESTSSATFFVTRKIHSFDTMLARAAMSAMGSGEQSSSPCRKANIFSPPS